MIDHRKQVGKAALRLKSSKKVQTGLHLRLAGPRVRVPTNGGPPTYV